MSRKASFACRFRWKCCAQNRLLILAPRLTAEFARAASVSFSQASTSVTNGRRLRGLAWEDISMTTETATNFWQSQSAYPFPFTRRRRIHELNYLLPRLERLAGTSLLDLRLRGWLAARVHPAPD